MSTNKCVEEQYQIMKSQHDSRLYKGLLLSNKMKVLLISDPTTNKSAAAMNVNISSMNDPDELPGLAHFCEHMLFLGTEKYPEQNAYDTYVSENGGNTNAHTSLDNTVYYFDINSEKLEGALDRFAQFFLAPLFTETLTEREINAIDSEYEINLMDDKVRFNQFQRSSGDPNHPYSKLTSGNRKTLHEVPEQEGINVRHKLLEFHEKYYSANLMSLSVLGKESLDELEHMVANVFSKVQNKDIDVPLWHEPPFKDEHFGNLWYIVPIKDMSQLIIFFPYLNILQFANVYYVSHLIGHGGEGSLASILEARELGSHLKCSVHYAFRGCLFLRIELYLIRDNCVLDTIELMFQYFNMLKMKGPIEWIYDECKNIVNMNFLYKEKSSPIRYVRYTAKAMQKYHMNEILFPKCAVNTWQQDLIQIMDFLTPENIRIYVISKEHEGKADETEIWYGIKYKRIKITMKSINTWNHVGCNAHLKLPSKNEFIPTTFDIKSESNIKKFPSILKDTLFIRLWYKKDDEFFLPKANMIFHFVSPFVYMDPVNCNLTEIFIIILRKLLREYTYAAKLTGLHWKFVSSKYGIGFVIHGYNDKQHVLLEKIISQMLNFEVDPEDFELVKKGYISKLENWDTDRPWNQAEYYLKSLLSEKIWLTNELLEFTTHLNVDELQRFISQFFSKVHVECLIHGNVTSKEATDIVELIESKLTIGIPRIKPLLQQQLVLHRETKLKDGCNFLFEAKNKLHKSSCTMVYYAIGLQSTESNMLLQLVVQIITEPCFDILRTQEQLDYVIFSDVFKMNVSQGLQITVESNEHPQNVEKLIDLFLISMLDYISVMSEEQFEKHKEALVTLRSEKPKTLFDQYSLYWKEIESQHYNFDRTNIEIFYLRSITLQQLFNFYKENIHDKSRRRKLSIHVISTATFGETADRPTNEDVRKIDNILSFKNNQSLYPLPERFQILIERVNAFSNA